MLLELTRQLIEYARQHKTEPIPIIFNLASWKRKQPLVDWLVEQLNLIYSVPRNTASTWVKENHILLLLDGLDEVKRDEREKCVEAINQFRNVHGMTSLVVCSRIEEYTAICNKLTFEGAIVLQPLTSKQISTYFNQIGKKLTSLRHLLKQDKVLHELAKTPLMLSIMTLAYKDLSAEELHLLDKVGDRRAHLFNTYINHMFERSNRLGSATFTRGQALHSLSWLARMMLQHNVMAYQIESMQPDWLLDRAQRRLYGLYVGLTSGLFGWLILGVISGLILGLIKGRNGELSSGLSLGLSVVLIFGPILGLFCGISVWLSSTQNDSITLVDRLKWSWKEAGRGLLMGLLMGLSGGLILWLIFVLLGGADIALTLGAFLVMPSVIVFAPTLGLIWGLTPKQIEETTYPGQRIKQTLSNTLLSTVIVGLFFGLIGGLLGIQTSRPIFWSLLGLLLGLFSGLLLQLVDIPYFGQNGGYLPIIRCYSLRWVIAKHNLLPYQLIPFLDYCTDLVFLRRVGGSYIFVHRLLMEHFAEMEV